MRKSSWIILGICFVLIAYLAVAYLLSGHTPETLTRADVVRMLQRMQADVAHKDVDALMDTVSPDSSVRIAHLNRDQLRLLLVRAFRDSGKLTANVSNIGLVGGVTDATVDFDLSVQETRPDLSSQIYPSSRITLHLKRIPVSRLLGLVRVKEWRIVGADTNGPDPTYFGDLG
ncbi:MAG TPA: hypothetical protein VGS41_05560 [Chthonomonadales bacterium]|nr:hypothetical protein [Chthonomonadales bacterium]